MKRRRFLSSVVKGAIVLAAPVGWVGKRIAIAPVRFAEAVRARRYPGRVVPIDPDSMRKSGPWAG
jgi:hypothetical protein